MYKKKCFFLGAFRTLLTLLYLKSYLNMLKVMFKYLKNLINQNKTSKVNQIQ